MRRKAALIALVAWLVAGVIAGGLLLMRHAALRVPEANDPRLASLAAQLSPRSIGVAHVMYRSCPCSGRTITHLLQRRAILGVDELVLIVDEDGASSPSDQRLIDAGFRVLTIKPHDLKERFGIHAAPVLVVARPDRSIAYIGGYNRHKQEARYADVAIVSDVVHATRTLDPLPVFGCATSAALER